MLDEAIYESGRDGADDGNVFGGNFGEISLCQNGPVDGDEIAVLSAQITVTYSPALGLRTAYPTVGVHFGRQIDIEVGLVQLRRITKLQRLSLSRIFPGK